MSTEASPKGKGGRAPANAGNDADSIMPLLFATIGNPAISFKKMAAMDELGRTESSLEHKFRKWRQKGREIAAENPENAGTLGTANAGGATTKKPRAPVKKGANGKDEGPVKQAGVEDEEDDIDEEAGAIKQESDEMSGIDGEMLPPPTKGKATATKGTKKRAASEKSADAEHERTEAPVKKAKVVKKGTAKVVKKSNAKLYSSSEDEEAVSEDEEKVPTTKPKGKGKSNVAAAHGKGKAAAKPTGPAKAKKGKADMAAEAGQIPIHEDEDADVDVDSEDGHHDGMIDMPFDEAA
ncbi:hypothetical protein HO173_005353 [Letharia columbiana]|uniref:Uncharacterized protein n=1 Tax=Letharia columbiana TaxID=112416 RepID=A0A8H6FXL8_9LECA|nr:uncharacterized protein HO173_005353 [Letharia columbiana]KAF6236572.1 hypothetical protein HO173_005353 [Letharia columbiana]